MGQGGESAAQVRGDGRPSPSPTPAEKADPIAAVGRRLSLSTAEVVRLRAVAAAVPLHTKVRSAQKDDAAVALLLLVDQACAAPDYATLGKGWFYPDSRMEYRRRLHDVFTCAASRARQLASAAHLTERLKAVAAEDSPKKAATDLTALICATFIDEIGAGKGKGTPTSEWRPNLPAVRAALAAELLTPLRALTECDLTSTMGGSPVPSAAIDHVVADISAAVVAGRYSGTVDSWVYSNPGAKTQLAGLSLDAMRGWVFDDRVRHDDMGDLTTVDESGLGVFWATKIGGPSHGFDYEGQCLLPLVSNARHKVILVQDPSWPHHHPVGRAHFRLLHFEDGRTPVLWMETMNVDFRANGIDDGKFLAAAIVHAAAKAEKMGVALSLDTYAKRTAQQVIESRAELWAKGATLEVRQDRMVLRPSVGVVEASDYLSHKHDWVQTVEETTHEMRRLVYTPASAAKKEGGDGGEL
mmetsp:Transcript_1283/g.1866  ORF Transcript_1283/g.1866 Transcript_1283/m.1866 type:complete len:469 (+) Transcript_1283:273-1679(+)